MVHVIYDVNVGGLDRAFPATQQGMGTQLGSGPIFQGIRYQRGYGLGHPRQRGQGLGSLLKTFWHFVSPLAKSVGKSLTNEGLTTGARILENIAQGADVKDAVVTEGKRAMRSLAQATSDEIKRRQGQAGSGGLGPASASRRRSRKPRVHSVNAKRIVGRSALSSSVKKRRRIDTLGTY